MKKIISLLVIAALVLSIVPFSAFAAFSVFVEDISSISYSPADENAYIFYEGVNCEVRDNGEGEYNWYVLNFNVGDVLTVNYSNGRPRAYTAEFRDGELYFVSGEDALKQWDDVSRRDDQETNHWVVGGTYTFYVEYAGKSAPVTAKVVANPVESISYTPRRPIVRYLEVGGNFEYDEQAQEQYYRYNVIERSNNDILTVSYNDGRGTVDYRCTFDPEPMYVSTIDETDIIRYEEVEMFDEQRKTHFNLGDDNCYYVQYMGKTAEIRVSIVTNPITSVVYTPARDIEMYEYSNGEWRERDGEQVFEYGVPWFKSGDTLAVTYSENGETVVYTYYDYYDNERGIQYKGFYDDEFNLIPDSDTLYVSGIGTYEWQLGNDNYMYAVYKDNRSNSVRVNIIQNPVKAIRFERANDVVIVENSNMYYDGWDDRYYYSIPYHQTGDKLIIIDNDDIETVYEYQYNGVYKSDGKEDIAANDVHFYNDQRENPWGLGEHEYTIEYLGREYSLTATVIENPVKSIQYIQANPIELIENTEGEYDAELGYFRYYYDWYDDGDKLIVEDKSGSKKEYVYKQVDGGQQWEYAFIADDGSTIELSEVQFHDEQSTDPWHIGDDNVLFVEYLGAKCSIYVKIKENPVKEIRFEPAVEPTVMVGVRSFYSEWAGYEIFDTPPFNQGDRLIVVDKNDVEKVYTARFDEYRYIFAADDGDEIDEMNLYRGSEQWEKAWTIGSDNEYYIEYLGAQCFVKCTVVDNPVESIEYIPMEKTKYLENTNGYYDDWDERFYYDLPRVNNGDKLIVNYKDPELGRVEYTATFDVSIDRMTYVSDAGDVIVEDDKFEFYDDQYMNPWVVGENHYTVSYCGKSAEATVIIVENNLAGITYKSVSMPQVWIADYATEINEETGEEYKQYNIPDFQEGDILTIHYNDETSKDFVLIFDESDGERYFVNGDEKYHQYTLFVFDNQIDEQWSLGTDNFYSIDFYGFTTNIQVEVIETDVERISFKPVSEIVLEENSGGEYRFDDQGQKFYLYSNISIINVGDILTVTYKNGEVVEYVLGDDPENETWFLRSNDGREIDTQEVDIDDHQYEKHWGVGNNNFDIIYHGVRTTVTVKIKGEYIPGDINNDGEVNNKDLTRLFQYLSEWDVEVNVAALDVNGDGDVNNKDLTRLFQYLSEWDVEIH